MNKEIICIGCPMGCPLTVTVEAGKVTNVTGDTCRKGKEYAEAECINPTRTVTTTVSIKNAMYALISVRTSKPIPKDKIGECVRHLRRIEVEAPVTAGEVIVKDILQTGADIIATKSLDLYQ
ncbi:MAG TPA: NAD(FAD)-dependent dehydrogenase [Firmicutes bacterium]|nr:NAD(FAD)-dependent dehydrogenase [Bacillota bacterium]